MKKNESLLACYETKYTEAIKQEKTLNDLLELITPLDFLLIYYQGTKMEKRIQRLRQERQFTRDEDKKAEIDDTLRGYEPRDPSKIGIIVENLLGRAEQSGNKIGIVNGECYYFNGSYWKLVKDEFMKDLLAEAAEKSGIKHFKATRAKYKDDLFKQFLSTAVQMEPKQDDCRTVINLKNGTFVCSSGTYEFREFRADDMLTYQLPFEYNKEAKAPMFLKYLNEVMPDEDSQKVMSEYIGYIFAKHLKLEKCLVLVGNGANGKSVFGDIVTALLGKQNVSSYALNTLCDGTGYYRAQLGHYLLNFCSEMGSRNADNEMVKQLISNEAVGVRSIHKDPITIHNYCRFLFNTNILPRHVEVSHGYFRRFLFLVFDKTIPEEERNPELAQQIIANELPGVFNWVLDGLDRLLSNKKFSYSERIANTIETVQKESNSVALFIEEDNLVPSLDKHTTSTELYKKYDSYCRQDSGSHPVSKTEFLRRIEALDFNVKRNATNNATWIYCEIKVQEQPKAQSVNEFIDELLNKSKQDKNKND